MKDKNVIEKWNLLRGNPNVGCFKLSRGAAYRSSRGRRRFCSDARRRHAPTTSAAIAAATVAPIGRRASGRRNPSATGAMVLGCFAGQPEERSKRKGRLLKSSL